MKLVLGLIALAQAGTWKRSSDDEVSPVSPALNCAMYNYDMYAAETDGVNRILPDFMIFEARMDNDTCILTMFPNTNDEHEAPLIDCDCSNPTDFVNGMEDPDLCEEAETLFELLEESDFDKEAVYNFKHQLCGGPSFEALCYLFNYERFNPGHEYEDQDWYQSIYGPSVHVDDSCDDTQCWGDFCTLFEDGEDDGWEIPCNCNKPEEFMKDIFNEDVCEEVKNFPADMTEGMNQEGLDKFEALVCGREGIPDPSEGSSDGSNDDGSNDEFSLESLCYFFNYEHFAHHVAGPDDGDVPTIFPANFKFDDDIDDGVDICIMKVEGEGDVDRIPCDCSNPREFMKNMLNKDVCEDAKILAANPDEGMSQAGLDNFESLVCGFQTNFLSFGLILLCTLFKF